LYVPPKHCVHVPPSGPLDPALQMQAATAVLPAGELESAGQPTQGEFPEPDLYVPPKHRVHVPPFGPEYPASHWHSDCDVLPCKACEYAGQVSHTFPGVFVSDNRLLCSSDATNAKSLTDRW